jgi:hypothetical protein
VSGGDEKAGMDLAHVLDGMFETGFDDLPEDARREVTRRFHPFRWENLSPAQRHTLALAADGEAPGQEDEFSRHWKLYAERAELLRQVSEWWLAATPTAADKATQEDRVAALRKRIEEIDATIAGPVPPSVGAPATASAGGKAGGAPASGLERSDAMTIEIEAALQSLGENASPSKVMAYLKELVGKPGTSIVDVAPNGVLWHRHSGKLEKLTDKSLTDRLSRLRKRASTR